jgi:AbrB family looped-hinge helix DNA binding protein
MAGGNPLVARMTAGGRIVIPAAYREALGIKPGDDVVLQLESGEIRLYTRKRAPFRKTCRSRMSCFVSARGSKPLPQQLYAKSCQFPLASARRT